MFCHVGLARCVLKIAGSWLAALICRGIGVTSDVGLNGKAPPPVAGCITPSDAGGS